MLHNNNNKFKPDGQIKDAETNQHRIVFPAFEVSTKRIGFGNGSNRVTTVAYEVKYHFGHYDVNNDALFDHSDSEIGISNQEIDEKKKYTNLILTKKDNNKEKRISNIDFMIINTSDDLGKLNKNKFSITEDIPNYTPKEHSQLFQSCLGRYIYVWLIYSLDEQKINYKYNINALEKVQDYFSNNMNAKLPEHSSQRKMVSHK